MSTILDAARGAYRSGLVALPVAADGSKRPDVATWREFQTRTTTIAERQAFNFAAREGLGIVAGAASHVEAWDFDCGAIFDAFVVAADACGLGELVARLRAGYEDETPSGGRRWLVRYPSSVTWRDCTLARRPGRDGEPTIKVLIELPTFAIVAPSNGSTHPSGRAYIRCAGDFSTIANYTADERDALMELARSFDQMPRVPHEAPKTGSTTATDGTRPGDDYNTRTTWPEILEPAGWTRVYARGEVIFWRRPGKRDGLSATTNYGGSDLFYPFSSSTEFEPDRSYSKFGVFAVLHHGGDFAAAARALSEQGYGTPEPEIAIVNEPVTCAGPAVHVTVGDSVLAPLPDAAYSGWFNRGSLHAIGGSSGAGKTTLILDLLRRARRGETFLGHVGRRHDFLVIFADRGTVSNTETFQRMGIDPATFPVTHIDGVPHAATSAARILAAIEACEELPAAVFIEGADMLVEDPSKPAVVTAFMAALLKIAEHYGLAIILSVGAGKAKPKEGYALKRDQLFGSIMWSRRSDTVLVLTITGDGTEPRRHLAVLHRNAAAETFALEYRDGRLVPAATTAASEGDYVAWMREAERFTKNQFRTAFNLSGSRANDLLDGYMKVGTLRIRVRDDRTTYVVRRPEADKPASMSTPKVDRHSATDPAPNVVHFSSGHGHSVEGETRQNPNVFESTPPNSLIPPKTLSTVHSGHSLSANVDSGHADRVSPRARGAAAPDIAGGPLPDWVTADDGPPPAAGSSDAAFAEHDDAEVIA
ncbi:MAG: AAA family ATPase [Acidobacteria bacterium]|nr:AAA family ATPase [Acidobacteriota bacterium]